MKSDNKENKCHSKNGSHKGRGWMMLLCIAIMIGIPLIILSSTAGGFNTALLGAAIIPIVLCLVMHGLMMKYMMSPPHEKNNEKQESTAEPKLIDEPSKSNNQFKA
tara:strand:+ start:31272 stop:31589 length:318 start_codon:yes stop_codon:yes gene_type:complete